MHEHIRNTVENLLNMMSESLALYRSVNVSDLKGMGPNTLSSIIQSKENSLTALLKEFNRIYPDFRPKEFPVSSKPVSQLYSYMLSLENKIASLVQSDLLPNIPSKAHEGTYTIAANIRSNSESTVVKLNNMLNIRGEESNSYFNVANTILLVASTLETYEKENLQEQASLCRQLIEENQKLFKESFSKKLILYTPVYSDTCCSICKKFNIKLSDFLKLNKINNPYSKPLSKYLIIITD